jgi:exodeoxyribonuclease-3
MKIASWNINSIKARLENLCQWIDSVQPDILFMQELKGVAENFPKEAFETRGYHLAIHGQKAYNGVAITSKFPVTEISNSVLSEDEHARYLEVEIENIRMINVYCPNGNPVNGDKFPYKLEWFDALINRCNALFENDIPFLIGGDFNIIPTENDVHDPKAWEGDALYRQEVWGKFRTLQNMGLYDAYRMKHPHERDCFTFWDYQAGAWPQNKGIRIDHFLLTSDLADRLQSCSIDHEPRAWDKASDHTPITIEL